MEQDLIEAQQSLMEATGGNRNAVASRATMRTQDWIRLNPRRAQMLINGEHGYPVEWSLRRKWGRKLTVQPDYETAERVAQEIADKTDRPVEIHHRPKPDVAVLAFIVEPSSKAVL